MMTDLPPLRELLALARRTLANPRQGAAEVLQMAPGRDALWLLFALVLVLTMFIGELATLLIPAPEGAAQLSVLVIGLVQAVMFGLIAFGMARIGQAFGGRGDFDGALALVTWLMFVFILVQIAQVAVMVILPPLAALAFVVGMGLFFWLLVNFIAELHGFTSLAQVFLGVLLTTFLVGFILYFFAESFGLTIITP